MLLTQLLLKPVRARLVLVGPGIPAEFKKDGITNILSLLCIPHGRGRPQLGKDAMREIYMYMVFMVWK